MKWQPIDDKAKSSGEILGWREDSGVMLVRWMCLVDFVPERELEDSDLSEADIWQDAWWAAGFDGACRLEGNELPTLWMPLPDAQK